MLRILHFIYGAFMGTTIEYVKTNRKEFLSIQSKQLDSNCFLFQGGSGNSFLKQSGNKILFIDPGYEHIALKLKNIIQNLSLSANSGSNSQIQTQAQTKTQNNTQSDSKPHSSGSANSDFLAGKKLYLFHTSASVLRASGAKHYPMAQQIEWDEGESKLQTLNEFGAKVLSYKNAQAEQNHVYVFESEKILVLGDLFYNHYHPILQASSNLAQWQLALEDILNKYPDFQYIPGEGELCGSAELIKMIEYVKALQNSELEFAYMRANFDWRELTGFTSLEENFDISRKIGPGIRQI